MTFTLGIPATLSWMISSSGVIPTCLLFSRNFSVFTCNVKKHKGPGVPFPQKTRISNENIGKDYFGPKNFNLVSSLGRSSSHPSAQSAINSVKCYLIEGCWFTYHSQFSGNLKLIGLTVAGKRSMSRKPTLAHA